MTYETIKRLRDAIVARICRLNPQVRAGEWLVWRSATERMHLLTFCCRTYLALHVVATPRTYRDLWDWFNQSRYTQISSDKPDFLARLREVLADYGLDF